VSEHEDSDLAMSDSDYFFREISYTRVGAVIESAGRLNFLQFVFGVFLFFSAPPFSVMPGGSLPRDRLSFPSAGEKPDSNS
jgi:hypothetical protein